MKRTKTREYSFLHCQVRSNERYGVHLEHKDWEWLNARMREQWQRRWAKGDLDKDSKQIEGIVQLGVRQFFCTYEKERDCVTTLLPPASMPKR